MWDMRGMHKVILGHEVKGRWEDSSHRVGVWNLGQPGSGGSRRGGIGDEREAVGGSSQSRMNVIDREGGDSISNVCLGGLTSLSPHHNNSPESTSLSKENGDEL